MQPVPAHDEKANAVLMYSETLVTVLSEDEVRVRERRVYKILRPEGHDTASSASRLHRTRRSRR